jgi:D-arabinan exo alpha-(1,3)/(1,5)-arabinofuranosidase (non-reducing end)
MNALGRGHYVGVVLNILQNQGDWWGEGDEMMFIDDKAKPKITGTGSEDYLLGAWCYGGCGLSPSATPVRLFRSSGTAIQ